MDSLFYTLYDMLEFAFHTTFFLNVMHGDVMQLSNSFSNRNCAKVNRWLSIKWYEVLHRESSMSFWSLTIHSNILYNFYKYITLL